jgi:hypothetical protein
MIAINRDEDQDDKDDFVSENTIYESMVKEHDQIPIPLEEDIYCIGFRTFLQTNNAKQLDRITLKCVFTFMFQAMILALIFMMYLNVDTKGDNLKVDDLITEDSIKVGQPSINMTRLCCCFLLHVSILPELTSAKWMLTFAKYNPTAFSG